MTRHPARRFPVAMLAATACALALAAPPALAATQPLKATVIGSGSVNANEGTIAGCTESGGASCEGQYTEGTTVTLTATPGNERSMFAAWTGCTHESANVCEVEIGSAPKEVNAEFTAIPQRKLTIEATGPGTVTGTSPGPEFTPIECANGAPTCEAQYNKGATIVLFANHNERSTFAGWSTIEGNPRICTATISPCEVALSEAAKLKAEFTAIPQQKLTVNTTEGTGTGTVTGSQPGGEFTPINCGTTCEEQYNKGATITLTASRATHSKFTGWEDCANVISTSEFSPSECGVEMTEAKAVKAKFAAIPQAELKVEVDGSGEVTSSPSGIACTSATSPCHAEFDTEGPESTATLTATANPDDHLEKWEGGGCSGTGTCEVTMSAAKSVKAVFAPTLHKLTVTPTGPGSVSAPSGITGCEEGPHGTCEAQYQEGSTVVLTAAPAAHHHVAWGGCIPKSNPDECELTIGASDSGVEAAFAPNRHTLTLTPTGPGSVSANSGAISNCPSFGGACAGEYDETSTVTLTATPAAHYHVDWTGCTPKPKPDEDECEVEIGASDSGVEAAFAPNRHTLTLTPTGPGSVSADSGAISHCSATGGTCAGSYIEAATLTLTAHPAPYQAVTWSGCTHRAANTCEVEIGASDSEVKAAFAPIAYTLTLTKAGSGSGSLTCNGGACATGYTEGTALTLAATPASGSAFAGWSGAGCSGTGTCKLTLEADTSLTATFNANPPQPIEEEKKPPPLKCHKGFVKKNGRCVYKPKPRHHKKKH